VKVAALLLLGAAACVPAVAHGPRVEPGFSFGASASVLARAKHQTSYANPFVLGPLGLDLGYGWSGTETTPGVRLGAEMLFPLLPFDPDVYVQLPSKMLLGAQGGIGIAATEFPIAGLMPYAQYGVVGSNRTGFYATQGYLHQGRAERIGFSLPAAHDDAWVSTVAYQWERGLPVWRVFATGVFGRRFSDNCGDVGVSCRSLPRPWSLMLGGAFEIDIRHSLAANR